MVFRDASPAPADEAPVAAPPGPDPAPAVEQAVFYQGAMQAMDAREYALATALLHRFLDVAPPNAKALTNLGFCHFQLAEYDSAARAFHGALQLRPDHLRTWIMYGSVQMAAGEVAEGLRAFDRAYRLHPASPYERMLHGQVRLMLGDAAGWDDLESRWSAEQVRRGLPFTPSAERPPWTGAPEPARTLCIHAEGGFGDTIMFSRFVPVAAQRVGSVVVAVSPPVARLLSTVPGVSEVVTSRHAIPEDSLHTSFASLPALTGARPGEAVPPEYFHASDRVWELPPAEGPRVGLVWAGSSGTTHDLDRSCPDVSLLAPLLTVRGSQWISLQVGARAAEADVLGILPTPALSDFADTASLLRQLDLVVTVDTAVAHLAGSLGLPTWIMIPTVPEYRWPLRGDSTHWYPSARLFRRRRSTDWTEMVERIRAELEAGSVPRRTG
jgi:tetratricopeptide (TPR) repeat protein